MQQVLDSGAAPLASADGGHVSVAVENLTTGAYASYGGSEGYHTASIVKVDILATLLYQDQQRGTTLDEDDQEQAAAMIEDSDNDAASDLWDTVGGAAAVAAANQAFGLKETTPGSGSYWGLTTTTAEDQIRLLRQVFTSQSVLSSSSRDYIQDLMSQVDPAQHWGVSAAGDSGTQSLVKNGWLPDPDLWVINSIGEITHNGQKMLVAVLSDDNDTEDGGISLVQEMAEKAAAAESAR